MAEVVLIGRRGDCIRVDEARVAEYGPDYRPWYGPTPPPGVETVFQLHPLQPVFEQHQAEVRRWEGRVRRLAPRPVLRTPLPEEADELPEPEEAATPPVEEPDDE